MANSKFTPEQAAALVASDEPTFILRGKDALAVYAICEYKNQLVTSQQADFEAASKVREVEREFLAWQKANPDKVQFPTI